MERQELDLEDLNRGLKATLEEFPEDKNRKKRSRYHRSRSRRSGKRKTSGKKKKITPYQVFKCAVSVAAVLLLTAILVFSVVYIKGKIGLKGSAVGGQMVAGPEGAEISGDQVIYKGRKYIPRKDMVTVLCAGMDQSVGHQDNRDGESGSQDTLFLMAADTKSGEIAFLNLPVTWMEQQDWNDQEIAGWISGFLYGLPVSGYIALDYQGVSVLNDALNGVPVTMYDDLTEFDPAFEKGRTMILKGQQAYTYVKSRDTGSPESGEKRMERQKQYLEAFLDTMAAGAKSDLSLPFLLHQKAAEYVNTDLDFSESVYLISLLLGVDFQEADICSVPGQADGNGTGWIVNEEELYELILEIFYEKL